MDDEHVIELRLLGGWSLSAGGTSVSVGTRQQKLLAALAVHGRRPRHFLSGLLWPECSEAHAMGSLRTSVFTVSRRLPGTITACGHDLLLAPSVDVDLHRLLEHLTRRTASDDRWFLGPARAELLPGWYDDWVVVEQERLRALYINVTEQLAQASLEHRDVYRALTLAQAVRELDPLRESAVRILIESHLAIGNVAAALATFRGFRAIMAEELGARPSSRVTDLIHPVQQR